MTRNLLLDDGRYAVILRRKPIKPNIAELNNHAAAGTGTVVGADIGNKPDAETVVVPSAPI